MGIKHGVNSLEPCSKKSVAASTTPVSYPFKMDISLNLSEQALFVQNERAFQPYRLQRTRTELSPFTETASSF